MASVVSSASVSSDMQIINSWSDVTRFVGSIVAYKTNSFCFGSDQGYVLEDKSIKFGYIDKEVREWNVPKPKTLKPTYDRIEKGYNMRQLLKPEDVHTDTPLIDSRLKLDSISLRLASSNEINEISKAITANQAKFTHMVEIEDKINAIFEQHLPSKQKFSAVVSSEPQPVYASAAINPDDRKHEVSKK